jgi:hypothetical protein
MHDETPKFKDIPRLTDQGASNDAAAYPDTIPTDQASQSFVTLKLHAVTVRTGETATDPTPSVYLDIKHFLYWFDELAKRIADLISMQQNLALSLQINPTFNTIKESR